MVKEDPDTVKMEPYLATLPNKVHDVDGLPLDEADGDWIAATSDCYILDQEAPSEASLPARALVDVALQRLGTDDLKAPPL